MEWIKLPNKKISEEARSFISKLNVPKKFKPLWENQGEAIYLIDKYLKKVDNVLLDMPTGTGKCQKFDTLVLTDNGLRELHTINKEDHVKSFNIDELSMNEKECERRYNNGKKRCIKIITNQGYEVESTPNHKYVVMSSDGKLIWRKTKDLNEGDYIVIVRDTRMYPKRNIPVNWSYQRIIKDFTSIGIRVPKVINSKFGRLIGYLVGDGNYGQLKHSMIALTNNDEEIIMDFKNIIYELFHLEVAVKGRRGSSVKSLEVYSIALRSFLFDMGLDFVVREDKDVPVCILNSPREVQVEFLKGLFDTDGGVNENGIEYTTISNKLAEKVHLMLLNEGIVSKKEVRYTKYEKDSNKYFKSYRIMIYGADVNLFSERIGFGLLRKQNMLNKYFKDKVNNPNLDVVPNIHFILRGIWNKFKGVHQRKVLLAGGHSYKEEGGLGAYRILKGRGITRSYWNKYISNPKTNKNTRNSSYGNLRRFLEIFEPECMDMNEYKYLEKIVKLKFFYDKVVSLEKSELVSTYDIQINGTPSYIANGFISHNSLIAVLSVNVHKRDYYLCTFVNALIDQYLRDFEKLACIRGRANYDCMNEIFMKANESKCVLDKKYSCEFKSKGDCPYNNALYKAGMSDEVLTTPAYLYRMINKKLSKRGLFLIDEAHKLEDFYQTLIGLKITVNRWNRYGLGDELYKTMKNVNNNYDDMGDKVNRWVEIINEMKENAEDTISRLRFSIRKLKEGSPDETKLRKQMIHAKNFVYAIENMLEYYGGEGILVVTHSFGKKTQYVELKPINIYDFGRKLLNRVAGKRIFMSATMPLPPQVFTNNLGLEEDNSVFIQVVEHTFPVENRLVRLRYAGDMTYKHINQTLPKMVKKIEDIMGENKDKRGLILPYTHRIRNYILDNVNGNNRNRIISRDDYRLALDTFKDSKRNDIVLISTVNEGLDLYGKLAEFLIMCKCPYPNINDEYIKAKMNTVFCGECDKVYIPKESQEELFCKVCGGVLKDVGYKWYSSKVGLEIMQAMGRITRSKNEYTQLYLLDSAFDRWYSRNKNILPKWFRESIRRV